MTPSLQLFVSMLLVLVACGMILCRIEKMMKGVTKTRVFLQYATMAGAMFGAMLLLFTPYFGLALGTAALGVIVYLWLSMNRWRYGAPKGTLNESLSEADMAKINGRGKS